VNVTVAIPYREKCPYRAQSLPFVIDAYKALGHDAIVVDSPHDEFNRAAARNEAVRRAQDGIVVISDSDILPDAAARSSAVSGARYGGMHLAYDYYRALLWGSTKRYYRGGVDPNKLPMAYDARDCTAGIIVIRCDEWWRAGGMDERFYRWGWEDTAFATAAETILGQPRRYHKGTVNHLWHPSEVRIHQPSYQANKALYEQYEVCAGNPDAMRELICTR